MTTLDLTSPVADMYLTAGTFFGENDHPVQRTPQGGWIFVDLCPRLLRGVDLVQTGQALRGGHYYGMQSIDV